MIEKIIEASIRNRFLVLLIAIALAIWGLYAAMDTPVDAIPDLSENQVIVFTDWMGRSPKEIEDQVTYPLSRKLQGLTGIKDVRSSSEFNFSMITLIFEDNVNFYFARQRVAEKLSQVSNALPAGVVPYLAPDTTALGQIFFYTVEPSAAHPMDPQRLWALNKFQIVPQLNAAAGVADVATVGGMPLEYQIDVRPEALRSYGITLGDLYAAVARSNLAVGGGVIQKNNAEYLVRGIGWIKDKKDIENTVIREVSGTPLYVKNVAIVQLGTQFRRGVFEKDGNDVAGGIVMMRHGENPLAVTRRIKEKIQELQSALPPGVRIVPAYDRTRLITGAIHTLSEVMWHEMVIASIAILLILLHVRSVFVICVTLPLSVLFSFLLMWILRRLGIIDIQANIMSLAGITISIGILVDQAIVMTENATHHLKEHFGDKPVTGDTRELVIPACRTVGRPIFFSVMIMLISFIPVFMLSGREGKLFHPLAFTKCFALIGTALLSVTVVPALIPMFIKGRLRREEDNWIVRSFMNVYKPLLTWALPRHNLVMWMFAALLIVAAGLFPVQALFGLGTSETAWRVAFLVILAIVTAIAVIRTTGSYTHFLVFIALCSVTFLVFRAEAVGLAVVVANFAAQLSIDIDPEIIANLFRSASEALDGTVSTVVAVSPVGPTLTVLTLMFLGLIAYVMVSSALVRQAPWKSLAFGSLVLIALWIYPYQKIGVAYMPALDEGTLLDMPVTWPRISVTQAADDLKHRDGLLRGFPEVESVIGKAGRADTPTDPAPLDMFETLVNFRPKAHWPKRVLKYDDAVRQTRDVLRVLEEQGFVAKAQYEDDRDSLINEAAMKALERFDETMRALALRRYQEFEHELGPVLTRYAIERTMRRFQKAGDLVWPEGVDPQKHVDELTDKLAPDFGPALAKNPAVEDISKISVEVANHLKSIGALKDIVDALQLKESVPSRIWGKVTSVFGEEPKTFAGAVLQSTVDKRAALWRERVHEINWELFDYGVEAFTWYALEEVIHSAYRSALLGTASRGYDSECFHSETLKAQIVGQISKLPLKAGKLETCPTALAFLPLSEELTQPLKNRVFFWQRQSGPKGDLIDDEFGRVLQVPGYSNIFTQPIINRIEMLSTGVRTPIGIKVFGPDLEIIDTICKQIEAAVKPLNGARDVVAAPTRGKGYLEIDIDREKAARFGITVEDIQNEIEVALGGRVVTYTVEKRERFPVRIRYARAFREDEETVRRLLVSPGSMATPAAMELRGPDVQSGMQQSGGIHEAAPKHAKQGKPLIPLSAVATVRIVEGPPMIKSENGSLLNYVTMNVRGRDIVGFVDEAKRVVAQKVQLPEGVHIEWTGEFEHQVRAARTLVLVTPIVFVIIFVILYVTYNDLADAVLMMFAVPEALAGGAFFMYLFPKFVNGWNAPPMDFSVAVWVGFIACFGMATETGIIMLVYLREAIDKRGGLENIQSLEELRQAVIEGAVHRLRPKLLTEGVAIIAIFPMVFATGVGGEILAPMALPVLGGLLISDEVVDLFLPVRFYWVRRARWLKLQQAKAACGLATAV